MGLRINKLTKLAGTFTGTSTNPVATINATTFAVDTSSSVLGGLAAGKIWIGSAGNLPIAQTLSGAITVNNSGVTTLGSGIIVNANVNAAAAIALSKLAALSNSLAVVTNGSGVMTTSATTATQVGYLSTSTSDIQTQLNAKQATITGAASSVVTSNLSANIVAISDGSGKIASSAVTTTVLGYISTLSSNAQTQINTKLTVSLAAAVQGDIIWFNGANWTNLPRGTSGQTLQSTGSSIQWNTQTINGIPIGGSAGQYLAKNSGTDFDASWTSLTLSKVTDVTASAAQVNALATGYYDATSSVQTQLNNKLSVVLATNSLFVGVGGVATASTDIPTATTVGTAYIYRVGGTDVAVTDGGTGVSTIPALSVWVANTLNTITTVAPAASQSIRINAGGTAWEAYTPGAGISGLTTNRIPYATSSTSLGDDSALTWDATNNAITIDQARFHTTNGGGSNGNLFIGDTAGNFTLTGLGLVGIGLNSLKANTSGNFNTAFGYAALSSVTTGSLNTAIGDGALGLLVTGDSNIALGAGAANQITSGSNNIVIGNSDPTSGVSNQLIIQNIIYGLANAGTNTTVSTGFIGIGQPAPTYQLHITGNAANKNLLLVEEDGGVNILEVIEAAGVNKIGLFAAAPVAQATTGGAASTFAANTSLIANDTATWDGYTIGQIVKALRNIGILA